MDGNKSADKAATGIFDDLNELAHQFFESVSDTLHGTADSLRDGTELEPLVLPRDLYAHEASQTEWWYYTGHLEAESGRRYGFELVFFKRRTDLDKLGPVPMRLLGNPIYFAHFGLTDYRRASFRYAHHKSANGTFDKPASASQDHYHVKLGDWSVRESHGHHVLRATLDSDVLFEVSLNPVKPVIKNGKKLDGVSFKDEGEASRYFSYTRMEAEGVLTIDGRTERVTGLAWMDREFGTWTPTEKQKGWDWFSIQMNDETELMVYHLRDSKDKVSEYSSAFFIDKDGNSRFFPASEFKLSPTGKWKSPRSDATYPSGWTIEVPALDLSLELEPVLKDQELDTRGSTMIVYWEGACRVKGSKSGDTVSGNAYVELVGYDRSHENPSLIEFFLANRVEFKYPIRSFWE